MTYGEAPPAEGPAQPPDHVMHARLEAHGAVLMASDGPGGDAGKDNVWVSLTLDDVAEAERVFGALAEGGQVVMPIGETFWALRFGMLKDRFGVRGCVNYAASHADEQPAPSADVIEVDLRHAPRRDTASVEN